MSETNALDERVQAILRQAVAGLDPTDTAERIVWCRENDTHGVRMHLLDGDDVLEFHWGGRPLAMIRRADLLSDEPIRAEFVAEVPDTVPENL